MIVSKPRLRIGLVLLCLIACTFQGFIAQTHVHPHPDSLVATACLANNSPNNSPSISSAATSASDGQVDPCKHSRSARDSSCPLCQVVAHGAAAALLACDWSLPRLTGGEDTFAAYVSFPTIATVSFSWDSRGPPLT
jgi:hypothetical protein